MHRVYLFCFAVALFITVTSAHGFEASCDFRKCMNICRSEYESGCAGMCSRIISLCKQLVSKPEWVRNARRANSFPHVPVELGVRARGPLSRMD